MKQCVHLLPYKKRWVTPHHFYKLVNGVIHLDFLSGHKGIYSGKFEGRIEVHRERVPRTQIGGD